MVEERTVQATEVNDLEQAPDQPAQSTRLREILIGAGVVAVGATVLLLAQQLPAEAANSEFGSRWWPSLIGGAITLLGLAVAIVGALRPPVRDCEEPGATGIWQLLAILGLIVVYGIAWRFAHFLVVTPLLVLGIMTLLGGRGWRSLVLVPVVVTGALYGVFGLLLRVPL
ncbi:tripartite tricarboxylate transporter TctB family protein [Agrococcus baldri]|nr:tripartite tricarboxylate transporter TctB family protein [Agrococcus baldri]